MKFCLNTCLFLLPVFCSAQLKFGNLTVSTFCGTLKPQAAYTEFMKQSFVWKDSIHVNGCRTTSGDSLFTGIVKDSVSGQQTVIRSSYRSGRPTGEVLISQNDAVTGISFVSYYAFPTAEDSTVVSFIRYNTAGIIIEKGCSHVADCPENSFSNFFGKDDPDCSCKLYYDNGQLKTAFARLGGNYHGDYDDYYPSGALKEHRFYLFGRPWGTWSRYSEKGKRTERLVFRNGKPHGKWTVDQNFQ